MSADEFDAWSKSEDVAMHFNGLLMSLRTKTIASVTAATGLIVAGTDDINRALSLLGLAIVMSLIWIVDHCYYYRLLQGAVRDVMRLEESMPLVNLSHEIEKAISVKRNGKDNVPSHPGMPILLFYGIPVTLLLLSSNIETYASKGKHLPVFLFDVFWNCFVK